MFLLQRFNGLLMSIFNGEAYTSASSGNGKNYAHARSGDQMEQHIFDAATFGGAALQHDMLMITADEFNGVGGCLSMLSP